LKESSSLGDIETAQLGANLALEKNIALKHKKEAVDRAIGDYVTKRASVTSKILQLAIKDNKHLTAQAGKELNTIIEESIKGGKTGLVDFIKKYDIGSN